MIHATSPSSTLCVPPFASHLPPTLQEGYNFSDSTIIAIAALESDGRVPAAFNAF
ncbi:unnamed protein product [Periconia digitata]|uniref:Uncharacterized protein n=1 Tax=Periconia digitata TaxID=1303443 RepID=A0A9W4XZE8_9PLEO|nr:unnamed protein product [Periconia digitata]